MTQKIVPGSAQDAGLRPAAILARDGFTTRMGVIAATLGSAVGLGNIWKVPYLTGVNGGAAFIVIYLFSTLLVGLPVMIAELLLGRRAKADAITTLRTLGPSRQPWWIVGAMGVLGAFLILAFYTEVAAWVFAYVTLAVGGSILSTDAAVTSAAFDRLVTSPAQALVWQWVVLLLIGAILVAGVSRGIERTTKRLMPVLFGLLVLVGIRSLTLPGASAGVRFLLEPDFGAVTGATILTAMGLAFFKLSIGMGTMITYGSYFRDDQNIPATATQVMLADLLVSLLAGLAIFPAVFAFGVEPDAGPALLFITIPTVFASMPFGGVFLALFFVLTAIAATGAMLSLMEVPVAVLHRRFGLSRLTATAITVGLLAIVGSTAALSNSVLANTLIFGRTFFDLYDWLTSSLLLPLGGIAICLFAGWVWGAPELRRAVSNDGALANGTLFRVLLIALRYVAPTLILLVLLRGLGFI